MYRSTYRRFLVLCGTAGAALSAGAPSAVAGLTEVRSAANGEVGHEQILERLYGGDFSASGADYVGGDVAVRRLDDAGDGRLRLNSGTRLDLVGAFTGWQWDYSLENAAGQRVGAGSQTGSGFDVSGGFAAPEGSGPFEMVLDHASGRQYRSGDSVDQMVSYAVTDADGGDATLFFWEDWSRREGSDMDFNDLVFRATTPDVGGAAPAAVGDVPGPVSIPLPPAVLPGVMGLAGVGMVAMRRFRRRR